MFASNLIRSQHNTSQSKTGLQRRRFLLALAASGFAATAVPAVALAGDPITIERSPSKSVMRVRIEMDVKGNVNVPSDPLVSRKSDLSLPIESEAVLDYEERYRLPVDADPNSAVTAAERYYHEAKRTTTLNRKETEIVLRDSVRQTQVRRDSLPESVYSVDDFFTNEELGLLRVPVCSVALDELLPTTAISVGSVYQPSKDTVASVLNLSVVEKTDISIEVMAIDEANVRLQLRGKVHGSVEGVPTTINAVGKLTFDRKFGACSWLAIAVHEIREIGKAEPGFDVAATIKMVRQPLPSAIALPKQPAKIAITKPIPQDRLFIDLQSERVGVAAIMDRRWRMMIDLTGNAMMRMIDNDRSIAQCNLRPLAELKAGKQWTLDAFQEDVKRTLGEELQTLVEADQLLSETGLRVLRVVADGAVEGVPIRWIMMHFSDDSGRRVLATFTMSEDRVESFAGADTQLANSMRLLKVSNARDADLDDEIAESEPKAEVATRPAVQSPSDLR